METEEQRLRCHLDLVVSARMRAETIAAVAEAFAWVALGVGTASSIYLTPWWVWPVIALAGFGLGKGFAAVAHGMALVHWWRLGRRIMAGLEPKAAKR